MDLDGCHVDVARSLQRLASRPGDLWSALSTQAKIFDFTRERVVSGQELLGIAGFNLSGMVLDLANMDYKLMARVAGNAMTPAVLGAAMFAVSLYWFPCNASGQPFLRPPSPNFVLTVFSDNRSYNDDSSDGSSTSGLFFFQVTLCICTV